MYRALQNDQFNVLVELIDTIPPAGWRAGHPLARVAEAGAMARAFASAGPSSTDSTGMEDEAMAPVALGSIPDAEAPVDGGS